MSWKNITDQRLGYMTDEGEILRKPTLYSNGEYWNSKSSFPTRRNITNNWFVVLQVRKSLDENTRLDLLRIVEENYKPKTGKVTNKESKVENDISPE